MTTRQIGAAALAVLSAGEPALKCQAAYAMFKDWQEGNLGHTVFPTPSDTPNRPEKPELVSPMDVKRRRLGSEEGRAALLHAIAHIELNAIDLAADMIARFGNDNRISDDFREAFIGDWVSVCNDEARHFSMLSARLNEMGFSYGDYPAHNGLWEAAIDTKNDLAARLAVAPMVLEARGLDVTPGMIKKLTGAGDSKSAGILQIIYQEEIPHVATGVRWFSHICNRENLDEESAFKSLISKHFKGVIKPPFNNEARMKAGMPDHFYA